MIFIGLHLCLHLLQHNSLIKSSSALRRERERERARAVAMVATKSSHFLLLILVSVLQASTFASEKKSYIVYLGAHSHGLSGLSSIDYKRITNSHYEFLGSFVENRKAAKNAIFYSYTNHINGFAANLEAEEADEISKHPDVVSVFLNERVELHTTRSWEFLGLESHGQIPQESLWQKARFGEDTIIGSLDTGVWPESQSFHDDGIGPIPSRWKGLCQTEGSVRCNRKLIGARYFSKGYEARQGPLNASILSARDFSGHGTHTLSTAAGRFVIGANIFGYGNGTAKGGSPNARVAAYKVCWSTCYDADIIAAFDAAIGDRVDVLSVSLGGPPRDYFKNAIEIGSFHATMNGILVVCSAGNSGPQNGTVGNVAPWTLTVGASTMDREFTSSAKFGDETYINGQSLSVKYLPPNKSYPLILSGDAKSGNSTDGIFCTAGSLDPKKVKGKIVVCTGGVTGSVEKGEVVMKAGGVGMIIVDLPNTEIQAHAHVLPATDIPWESFAFISSYERSTKTPTAQIARPTTRLGVQPAPVMAAFSSQGPNSITPEILKPDITAPGVNVLAAYTQAKGPSSSPSDTRRVLFNVISGTSMSCPHISGIAGLLKTLHPNWTPSAIRSAIMTTSSTQDNKGTPIKNTSLSPSKATPFSYGAGHVRPNRAMDPGLVYDLTNTDYLNFLCAIGYNKTQFSSLTKQPYSCNPKHINLLNFNYPSITVPNLNGPTVVSRVVKNVGTPGTYTARIRAPVGILVSVTPMNLTFGKIGEEKAFKVSLQAKKGSVGGEYVFGALIWSDGKHYVRSPIVVKATKS